LTEAVQRTFDRHGTALPLDTPIGLTGEFAAAWNAQWRNAGSLLFDRPLFDRPRYGQLNSASPALPR